MMTSYFTPMDPSSSFFSSNWLTIFCPLLSTTLFINSYPHRINSTIHLIQLFLEKEILPLIKSIYTQSFPLTFMTIFMMIFYANSMGLYPYIYSHTTHMVINLPISFTFWLILMTYAWTNNTNFMLAHLIPQSTPPLLIPFMSLIELISLMIRPLTLSIRLSTNMIAGHLLLTLLSSLGTKLSTLMFSIVILPQLILLVLESSVSIIQAYIFMMLLILYATEIN